MTGAIQTPPVDQPEPPVAAPESARRALFFERMASHLRSQNWAAIFIEFLVVVFGVFLGFQLTNWNEERIEAQREQVYLVRLQDDFTEIRNRISEHFILYTDAIEGGDYLLSIVRASDAELRDITIDKARLARAFDALVSLRIPPPAPATYVEMVSEGQLSRLTDTALRDKLAEYDRLLGVVQEVSRVAVANAVSQTPILQRYFVTATRAVDAQTRLSGVRNELISYDISGMRADRDFATAATLLQRYALNSLEQRRIQMRLIDEILALLASGQRKQ